jgi:hypothetical protein
MKLVYNAEECRKLGSQLLAQPLYCQACSAWAQFGEVQETSEH